MVLECLEGEILELCFHSHMKDGHPVSSDCETCRYEYISV